MTRREIATQYFLEGYNCTQAVALAFADLLPVEREVLMKMSCSFGGGMGRLREVCGTVSGMALVIGALYGFFRSRNRCRQGGALRKGSGTCPSV